MSVLSHYYANIFETAAQLSDGERALLHVNASLNSVKVVLSENFMLNKNSTAMSSYELVNTSISNTSQTLMAPRSTPEIPNWLIPCYSIILLCAIVGNLLVISTLVQNRRMRTITNVFLLNLAISDILLGVLCMPVTLVGTLLRHFIFGEFLCKLISFSQAISVAVSSWTLVAISCERYYAICHPLRSRTWQTISHAYKIIAFIWLGSIICMTPIAVFSQLIPTSRKGLRKCREQWPEKSLVYERSYNIFLDLLLLVFPLLILCVAYILITRTLYVGMRNERALIFGSSGVNKSTQKLRDDTNPDLNKLGSNTLFNMRCYTGKRNDNGLHNEFVTGSDSLNGQTNDEASALDMYESQPYGESRTMKKTARRIDSSKKSQNLTDICLEKRSSSVKGTRRMLMTSPAGHPHLYCMRTASCKHNSRGCENNDILDGSTNGSTSIASMTVINMPQQHCFQLQQQRHQFHENIERIKCKSTSNSLRIPDTTLRRSNETKTLESKRRVIKMLFVLVLEFFICWTPLYVINTVAMFIGSAMYEYIDYTSISFFQLLAYSSSCCNPITYCFMNAGFRRAFLDTFRGLQWREGHFWQHKRKHEHNLSVAGNSITLANSVTVMTNNTLLDSPRL